MPTIRHSAPRSAQYRRCGDPRGTLSDAGRHAADLEPGQPHFVADQRSTPLRQVAEESADAATAIVRVDRHVSLLFPERLAEQISKTGRDQQGTPRVFLDLRLEAGFQAVEISLAQPVGRGFHAAGDLASNLREPSVAVDCRAPAADCTGELARLTPGPLAKLVGSAVQRVGERVLEAARSIPNR